MEYTLIDCVTDLIYGPYGTFDRARAHAEDFARWEILNGEGELIDWSREVPAPASGSDWPIGSEAPISGPLATIMHEAGFIASGNAARLLRLQGSEAEGMVQLGGIEHTVS